MTESGVALQSEVMVYYIDNNTGQTYVQIGDETYELIVGADVTDEVIGIELEAIRVYDPEDAEYYESGGLRIDKGGEEGEV